MTGHSLGGGIAKIVSAKMGVPVVAIRSVLPAARSMSALCCISRRIQGPCRGLTDFALPGFPVVLSSPGIALSHRIFNVSMDNIDKFEINLINVREPAGGQVVTTGNIPRALD